MPACARPVALGACGFTELVCVSVCAQGVTTFGQTASFDGRTRTDAGSGQFRGRERRMRTWADVPFSTVSLLACFPAWTMNVRQSPHRVGE